MRQLVGRCLGALLLCVGSIAPASAQSETFPSRPITILTGFPAGGSYDAMARKLADDVKKRLNQPVVVTSRPGAGGLVMVQALGAQPADGYTIGFTTSLNMTLDVHSGLVPFKAESVQPVISVARFQSVLIAGASKPYNSFAELVEHGRKRGYVQYGRQALVDELMVRGIVDVSKVEFNLIPYKGGTEVRLAAMSDQIDVGYVGAGYKPDVDARKLKLLATTAPDRIAEYPDVPTLKELGYPVSEESVALFLLPTGTPEAVRKTLESALRAAAEKPDFKVFLEKTLTLKPEVRSGNDLQTLLDSQSAQWKGLLEQKRK